MGLMMETPEGEVILVPSDDTRRLAGAVSKSQWARFAGEPCCLCRQPLFHADLTPSAVLGFTRQGAIRLAHRCCKENFVKVLRELPARRLHQLMFEIEEEVNFGQRDDITQPATGTEP